jgi:hypothetical protein
LADDEARILPVGGAAQVLDLSSEAFGSSMLADGQLAAEVDPKGAALPAPTPMPAELWQVDVMT